MKTHFHEETLTYDGQQLTSQFAYRHFDVLGDSIVSFIGPCDVDLQHMVDLEDVLRRAPIHSENMLHFIAEHFTASLTEVICYQRLMMDLIITEMTTEKEDLKLSRRGDDIYDDVFKVSVSVATKSPVSCLIHTGINISSKNTPLPTKGLADYGINPHALATGVMNRYRAEIDGIMKARVKVRAVG